MELKAIDYSRVVLLTTVHRPQGQLFLPKAGFDLVARYNFQKAPTQEELMGDTYIFKHGVFQDTAISEFGIYPDGIVVTSRSETPLIDAFLEDLLQWAANDLGLVETGIPPREKHYESALIVSSETDLNIVFEKFIRVSTMLTNHQKAYGLRPFVFDFSGFVLGVDPLSYAGRKPVGFSLARRINVPHSANIYHSIAPLRTAHHLSLLGTLEELWN